MVLVDAWIDRGCFCREGVVGRSLRKRHGNFETVMEDDVNGHILRAAFALYSHGAVLKYDLVSVWSAYGLVSRYKKFITS